MKPTPIKPRSIVNKAYLKAKASREEIDAFKAHLSTLLDYLKAKETEEHHKKHVANFLEQAFYGGRHHLNSKGDIDLAIHTGARPDSPVGVIIEAKRPGNTAGMFGERNVAAKSMCELVLYYLRERTGGNHDIRSLVITNGFEWCIFDSSAFDRLFFTKPLQRDYADWAARRKAGTSTEFFYDYIARPLLENEDADLPYVHIDLREFEQAARNQDPADDNRLILLFKLLSPTTLLKEPFGNDSNALNKEFYAELLHIIGLEEAKVDGKKLIRRHSRESRLGGSLLENTIELLEVNESLSKLPNRKSWGQSEGEQYFSVGLGLVITWVNRILFLKLLEAQLRGYHRTGEPYRLLDHREVADFDQLFDLFFMVLARRPSERKAKVARFAHVPYLNSSLFEKTDLEEQAFSINQLDNRATLPVHTKTVLKDQKGRRLAGELKTIEYIMRFLDAYDFSSEGGEEIQEENKTLINASVLGLIFEKINGYRDGSFYTPGFITMYMCRDTLRKAVIQKFNARFEWEVQDFEGLKEVLQPGKANRAAYNAAVDSLRVCDPAVGSGHFLVSALNELLAIKSDLGILSYRDGALVKEYGLRVVNDELVAVDYEEDMLFQYTLGRGGKAIPSLQRFQEAMFHQKQSLVENCLFGVDINPNSVKICRLRLWIELLKNAYYTEASGYTELETLPNIDINIKQGNSLVSRFALGDTMGAALKESGHSVAEYRDAVRSYYHVSGREEKQSLLGLIEKVKGTFRDTIDKPLQRKISVARGKLANLETEIANMSAFGQAIPKTVKADLARLKADFDQALTERKEVEENVIYRDAFEWRFEFPEVLGEEGDFVGFDVVVGNPPYIRIQDLHQYEGMAGHYKKRYESAGKGNYDIYVLFMELGLSLANSQHGAVSFILPHKFITSAYGAGIKRIIAEKAALRQLVHFGHQQVFHDATTYTCVISMSNEVQQAFELNQVDDLAGWSSDTAKGMRRTGMSAIQSAEWRLVDAEGMAVMERLARSGLTLEGVTSRIYQGLKTSLDKVFILELLQTSESGHLVRSQLSGKEFLLEDGLLFPLIKGGDGRRYHFRESNLVLLFPYDTLSGNLLPVEAIRSGFPATWAYLLEHKGELAGRENGKMDRADWYGYVYPKAIALMAKPKIFTPDIAPSPSFSFDHHGNKFFTGGAAGGYGIIAKGIDVHALLGILNSSVTAWYIAKTSTQMRGGYYSFESRFIRGLPIPVTDPASEALLAGLVQEAVSIKSVDPKASAAGLEERINRVVYSLFGLDEASIAAIEAFKAV
jgi:adenine-specific DNA-methyltransferase